MPSIGMQGQFFQSFEFPAGSELGAKNRLTVNEKDSEFDSDWTPLTRHSVRQRKAAIARDRGAVGIIFVAGPTG